jgi:hypothetical protein
MSEFKSSQILIEQEKWKEEKYHRKEILWGNRHKQKQKQTQRETETENEESYKENSAKTTQKRGKK